MLHCRRVNGLKKLAFTVLYACLSFPCIEVVHRTTVYILAYKEYSITILATSPEYVHARIRI